MSNEQELYEKNFDFTYNEMRHHMRLLKGGNITDPPYGIKNIFNEECKNVTIDIALLKRIHAYQVKFVNKNQEHIEFFGGNLTGVQVVRFLPSDRDYWFDEVVEINDGPLGELLIALPTVNEKWFISSDTFNLSCVWLAHAVLISKLDSKQKHDAMIDIFLILQYKFLTSILYHWFRYPADRATAEATYAQLSYKYAIKIYGSWSALLLARAEEIVSENSIHSHVLKDMKNDIEIIYILNDIQGRIKDILKNIYVVFDRVHNSNARIHTTSSVMLDHEGEEILKDKSHHLLEYTRYINTIISDKNSFIKSELTDIIESINNTMPSKLFIMTLEWMSNNYRQANSGVIEELVNKLMIYTFTFISDNKELIRKESDLAILISKLKGSLMSSRSSDEDLFKLRDIGDIIVKKATNNKNDSVISSVRTGVMLYVALRTFTLKHYS